MNAYPETMWVEIRHAYEKKQETVAELCERFGVSETAVYHRAKKLNWQRRRKLLAKPEQSEPQVLDRLYRSVEIKLAQLEARMSNQDDDLSIADHERETRALGQLIRNFEKVIGLEVGERGTRRSKPGGKSEHDEPADDIDPVRLREELAERIRRLREKGTDIAD